MPSLAIYIEYAEKRKTADSCCYDFVVFNTRGHHFSKIRYVVETGRRVI